jgi:Protein of unknown function (DUF1460)
MRTLAVSIFLALLAPLGALRAGGELPLAVTFKGRDVFDRLVAKAQRENWRALPLGDRTVRVALAMVGTPFKGYTLEIDDRVESPSVNFFGQDCWTTFEISLAFARMLHAKEPPYAPQDLLKMIELNRYRGGRCTGNYLSRFHFLEEMFYDNERRGLVTNITRRFRGADAERLSREIREMTVMWKNYRYLRNNPDLRPEMTRIEARASALPVYHIPKNRVAAIEPEIRNGDILAITCRDTGSYTSHVGLAYRDDQGVLRIIHASSPHNFGRVLVDSRLSDYLMTYADHAGVIVARPNEVAGPSVAVR